MKCPVCGQACRIDQGRVVYTEGGVHKTVYHPGCYPKRYDKAVRVILGASQKREDEHTMYAVLTAGRAIGELSSAILCGDLTLPQAETNARLGYELDMDDADEVIEADVAARAAEEGK
jgi:hypothetical protein